MEPRVVMSSRNEGIKGCLGRLSPDRLKLSRLLVFRYPRPAMSLIQGYSSGEDEGPVSLTNDAFGLASLPATKKPRVGPPKPMSVIPHSAPDVLSEVRRRSDSSKPPDSQKFCPRIP